MRCPRPQSSSRRFLEFLSLLFFFFPTFVADFYLRRRRLFDLVFWHFPVDLGLDLDVLQVLGVPETAPCTPGARCARLSRCGSRCNFAKLFITSLHVGGKERTDSKRTNLNERNRWIWINHEQTELPYKTCKCAYISLYHMPSGLVIELVQSSLACINTLCSALAPLYTDRLLCLSCACAFLFSSWTIPP